MYLSIRHVALILYPSKPSWFSPSNLLLSQRRSAAERGIRSDCISWRI